MLALLSPTQYHLARPVFEPLEYHLVVPAVLAGAAPGRVWVDDPANPQSGFLQAGHRCHLSGRPDNSLFNQDVRRIFLDEIYPQGQARGELEFALYYSSPGWETAVQFILDGKDPIFDQRHYYEFHGLNDPAWRERIPDGFFLQPVNAELLSQEGIAHLEDLRKETTSETPSLEFFLEKRFGFCLRSQNALAGWCLSEYNWAGRCEIGIETVEEYQRRGVAVITASALIEQALSCGYSRIGWDCWANNTASIRSALKIGFKKLHDYPVAFAWFDQTANLAVHGNLCFRRGQTVEALAWFERAFQAGQPPLWAYVVAAFACNCLGDSSAALDHLRAALDLGFKGLDWIRGSEYLQSLHATPEWQSMFGSDES